jgi:hypothetical protein
VIPFPYNLIAAGLALLLAFGTGWSVQGWHRDSLEKDRVETQAETDRLAHLSNIKRIDAVVVAQNRAAGRAISNRRDADAALSELGRVQAQSAAAVAAARVSHEACIDRTIALDDVFQSCASRYTALGETSDRHVNDLQTLIEAWPKP